MFAILNFKFQAKISDSFIYYTCLHSDINPNNPKKDNNVDGNCTDDNEVIDEDDFSSDGGDNEFSSDENCGCEVDVPDDDLDVDNTTKFKPRKHNSGDIIAYAHIMLKAPHPVRSEK
uniref:ZP domain-containing protein n=1 Tax=Rhabditophanes sp. KR3021 TaxID=114890 RepID=A0AC35TPM2_9BILA